ncbi:MAG: FAD-dependent oxidoreductase [Oscillospiraceae bacterium]|nr:FAD-dependent oxidoreductase [Oscillospiraceae bacterium]
MKSYDVAVIGGGLLGCFAARNLRRWNITVALLEAREDVCTGVSRANSAIVYPGYDHKPGTLKAEMTVRANARFDELCAELDVPFSRCGSLMLSYGKRADAVLHRKYENGLRGGVPGLRLLSGEEAMALEPTLAPAVSTALYAPGAGTVNPWELGIAAWENAVANGVKAYLNTRVLGLRREGNGYLVETNQESFSCRAVINCA